ncbi:MAG: selenocysteine-specific translation elongation factor [Pseudomonadota bacterium]
MEKFITIGVAGHVDHGKTSLVRCLTGIDTDRMKEEKLRGLSIESGVAPLVLDPELSIALVDVPGHSDFLKNTVRGLSCVDLAMLVVAADDGVMPQTVDHLEILDFFGARGGFVVLSKADLVDEEILNLAELEIRELIKGTFLDGKPVIPFSATTLHGIDLIRQTAKMEAVLTESKNLMSPFRLWIDQTKHVNGFGTVVSGTVISGHISKDAPVQLMPSGLKTRARFLESHGQRIERAVAGQRVGINLHKVSMEDAKRGTVLLAPDSGTSTYLINAELKVLQKTRKALNDRIRVKLFIGTLVVNAIVVMMEENRIEPGRSGLAQFRLSKPVSVQPKDCFAVSLLNVNGIIGGGLILEIPTEKFTKARSGKMVPILCALRENDVPAFVDLALDMAGHRPLSALSLHQRSGLPPNLLHLEITARMKAGTILDFGEQGVFLKKHYADLKDKTLFAAKQLLSSETMKGQISAGEVLDGVTLPLSVDLLQNILNELCSEQKLVRISGGFKIPDHEIQLSKGEDQLAQCLLDYAETSGLVPFSASRFCDEKGKTWNLDKTKKMLHFLHSQKKLIRLTNKRFIACSAMDEIKQRVKNHVLLHGSVKLSDCQEIMGFGRNMAIFIFEHLDEMDFTRREGDVRVLVSDAIT